MTAASDHQADRCDICGGQLEKALTVRDHQILQCAGCRHRQLRRIVDLDSHLEEVYGDDYFEGGEDGYSDYMASQPLLEQRGAEIRSLLERYGVESGGSVLDVGCAAGFLLAPFQSAGYSVVGVEPNEKIAQFARQTLDCEIVTGGCETFLAQEDNGHNRRFDAVLLVQVIAHLDSPTDVIAQLASRLEPGGLLFVETWNYQSLAARLFGARWHEYRPPSVRHWFSTHSLDEVCDRAGLIKLDGGIVWKWIQWQHARGLLAHTLTEDLGKPTFGRAFGTVSKLLPGRLALPYPGDDAFWSLYRRT